MPSIIVDVVTFDAALCWAARKHGPSNSSAYLQTGVVLGNQYNPAIVRLFPVMWKQPFLGVWEWNPVWLVSLGEASLGQLKSKA